MKFILLAAAGLLAVLIGVFGVTSADPVQAAYDGHAIVASSDTYVSISNDISVSTVPLGMEAATTRSSDQRSANTSAIGDAAIQATLVGQSLFDQDTILFVETHPTLSNTSGVLPNSGRSSAQHLRFSLGSSGEELAFIITIAALAIGLSSGGVLLRGSRMTRGHAQNALALTSSDDVSYFERNRRTVMVAPLLT